VPMRYLEGERNIRVSAPGASGFRYTTRQHTHIPNPTRGYVSATTAATPKRHRVAIDRTRMILRTFGGTSATGLRSTSSQIRKMGRKQQRYVKFHSLLEDANISRSYKVLGFCNSCAKYARHGGGMAS
jgi:hypothetical protein